MLVVLTTKTPRKSAPSFDYCNPMYIVVTWCSQTFWSKYLHNLLYESLKALLSGRAIIFAKLVDLIISLFICKNSETENCSYAQWIFLVCCVPAQAISNVIITLQMSLKRWCGVPKRRLWSLSLWMKALAKHFVMGVLFAFLNERYLFWALIRNAFFWFIEAPFQVAFCQLSRQVWSHRCSRRGNYSFSPWRRVLPYLFSTEVGSTYMIQCNWLDNYHWNAFTS